MKPYFLFIFALLFLAITPPYGNAVTMGQYEVIGKPSAVGTCSITIVNSIVAQLGGANQGPTKFCFCKSDGAAVPAYAWCSLSMAAAAVVVCAGGSATVCP